MATIPDRKTLASMRRADLQKLCKDRGLKANLKTDELIDLLVEMSKPVDPPRAAGRSSSMRTVSRAFSSSTARGRSGSVVIHEVAEEEEEGEDEQGPVAGADPPTMTSGQSMIPHAVGPATRTRQAKDAQFKLGVGRPSAIGGTGPRTVTKSLSLHKPNRVKGSASIQPTELAIREEDEDADHDVPMPEDSPEAGPSGTSHEDPANDPPSPLPSGESERFKVYVTAAVNPFQEQLDRLRAELQQATNKTAGVEALQTTVAELTSQVTALRARDAERSRLELEIQSLRQEISALKLGQLGTSDRERTESGFSVQSTGIAHSDAGTVVASSSLSSPPKSSLGKRHRGSEDINNLTGIIEPTETEGLTQEELSKHVLRPTRKKAKLGEGEEDGTHEPEEESAMVDDNMQVSAVPQRSAGFTIFSGTEESQTEAEPVVDDPPPTTRLSELFSFPAVTPPNGASPVPTSSATALENQAPMTGNNAFSFTFSSSIFQPITSTPAPGLSTITVPAPQPPISPSPAGPIVLGGRKPISRPNSRAAPASSSSAQANPGMAGPSRAPTGAGVISSTIVTQPRPLGTIAEESSAGGSSSADVSATRPSGLSALGMGLPGIVPLPMPPDTPSQPMKRTRYGTETERDTRFGDFGIEGVRTGFWTGAPPRN